jgi:chromosome segregation ATPase
MQELSASKKLAVIRYYLRGDSYDTIAARAGVSKGTVAAIVADLKAGRVPEVQEPADLIDLLRELAVDCRKANSTPERAMVGISALSRLQELHIEPAEIDSWATVYRQLSQDESKTQAFIRTALLLDEVREGSGLTLDGLEARVQELQEEVARLEPKVKQLRQCEKDLQNLQKRAKATTVEVTSLEKRRDDLRNEVVQKEKRETELIRRVEGLEERAGLAETRLAAGRTGLGLLDELGLSSQELAGFAQRVAGIAQHQRLRARFPA